MTRPHPLKQLDLCLFLALIALACTSLSAEESFVEADRLRLTGRYAEAGDFYDRLSKIDAPRATLGRAACLAAKGNEVDAEKLVLAAFAAHPASASLSAQLGWYAFQRGDYALASQRVEKALQLDDGNLMARWISAEQKRVSGELTKAEQEYQWFVRFYRQRPNNLDAESMHWIGLAMSQLARWNRNSDQFSFLVNDLYPVAFKENKNFWPARLESAILLAEKYNFADATTELNAALAINPNASEVHAWRAALALKTFDLEATRIALERAFAINPRLLVAHQLKADSLLADTRPADAMEVLEAALKLNPVDEETLGRLAATFGAMDGISTATDETRMGKLMLAVQERNPCCGCFYSSLAAGFELLRKYPQAAKFYEEARRRMPQLIHVSGELGMLQMRLGNEVEGSQILATAFEDDPFNVRVKNMLEVLDVLNDYAVLETDHFVIRFDRGRDELLAKFAAKYLEEEVYPEITQRLGYAPAGKSLFEIFNRAKNTGGHGWFSARMVGLPFIGTVGACAGKIVALASPNDLPKKYDWARVLRHEFVHVVNLQQTDFNIPHWFTEALAVSNEEQPRPPEWMTLLAKRLRANDVFHLDNINHGFARPKSGDDWTLAYCQAALYADYMSLTYGADATTKMLNAYSDRLSTRAALQRCFQVPQAEFEKGYRNFLEKRVVDVSRDQEALELNPAELQKIERIESKNPSQLAKLAYNYLLQNNNQKARRFADQCREMDQKNQLAAYVLARLRLSIGDNDQALSLLRETLNQDAPQEQALSLLAALAQKQGDSQQATRYLQLGAEKFPQSERWLKSLVRLYLEQEDTPRLREILTKLVTIDGENPTYVKKLAQLAIASEDWDAAKHWSTRAIHLDVQDADAHAWLGMALARKSKYASANEHFEAALRIEPRQADWQWEWVKSLAAMKKNDQATRIVRELLENNPDHIDAKKWLRQNAGE